MKQRKLEYNYCFSCRSEHEERNAKNKKEDSIPLCDKKNECEKVFDWQDDEDIIHKEPFEWIPENNLAWELYDRIVQLSDLQKIEFMKGTKQMSVFVPTLSKMDFILDHYLPNDIRPDDFDFLIDKISTIHQLKLEYRMSG